MIGWVIVIIVAIVIGYLIGKHFTEKAKFGDKEAVLNAQWEKKIANLEKKYELKLEKDKSLLEKLKEENKTHLEKLAKEWQVRYIQDIEELKNLFKDSEKIIKARSVSSSRRSLVGKFIERFIPFLKKIPYEPSDMHFLGQPVDYIVFQGLHEDKIDKVIFVEVKTGRSKLTKREKSLKETIERKRVGWKEINIDTADENTPDKEMANEDTSIKELYDTIEQKVSSVKSKIPKLEIEENDEEKDFICSECGKVLSLELDEEDNLEEGIEIDCPHCKEEITVYRDDLKENQEQEEDKGNYEENEWKCKHCGETFELDEDEKDEIEREGSVKVKCPSCHKKITCEYEENE